MKNQIVIIGQDYSAMLCMANSLKDYDVTIYKRVNKENKIKKIFKRVFLGKDIESLPSNVKEMKKFDVKLNSDEFAELIINKFKNYDSKILIIPTSDFTASLIDECKEKYDDKFVFPNINKKNNEIIELMDKSKQKEVAKKCGLNVIPEYNIEQKNGEYIIPEEIEFPVFIKPQISYMGNKTIMKKCDNIVELKETLNLIKEDFNCPLLIEKYVQIEKEYAILGCSFNKEIVIPGVIEKIATAKGKVNGVTLKGKTRPDDSYKELIAKIKYFINELKFDGLFDIELYEENGILYFNELNLRFGAEGYGITGSGVNLPEIYAKKVFNDKIIEVPKIKERKFLSNKANLDSYKNCNITWKEYKKNSRDVDFEFIKSQNLKIRFSFFRMELLDRFKKLFK